MIFGIGGGSLNSKFGIQHPSGLVIPIPKNLRITSTTATTISYAWDASAGVDGYQFGIYEDASCTVLIELITIYGASTTTYTWDMTYFQLATNYFGRVIANGDSSITGAQRTIFYPKFKAFVAIGATTSNVDRLFADKYCYTATQALTPWIWNGVGTGLATAVGSPTFTAGVGFTHNGSSYINTQFNPSTNGVAYTLADAGWYHGIISTNTTGEHIIGGAYDSLIPRFESRIADRFAGTLYWSINAADYLSFSDTSTISSIQVKISGGVQSIKTDNNTHPISGYNADHLGNFVFFRAAFNYNGTALGQMEAGCIDSWLCLGNSTLDKDKIITALAS